MDGNAIERTIRAYVPQVIHMSLATVGESADGTTLPWVCEVHVAYDDDLNLYWMSSQASRHSKEVAANPHVAGTIVVQHKAGDLARGVTFEGVAEIVEGVDADHLAYKVYADRFPERAEKVLESYQHDGEDVPRIYKVAVSDYYLIDAQATGRPEKYHLNWR